MENKKEIIEVLQMLASLTSEVCWLLPPCNGVRDWNNYEKSLWKDIFQKLEDIGFSKEDLMEIYKTNYELYLKEKNKK